MVSVSVNVCVCVWRIHYCECFGPRPRESPKNHKSEERFPSSTLGHFSMKLPPTLLLMLYAAEALVAMVISSPNSVPFSTRPPFDEILPVPACFCTAGCTVGTWCFGLKLPVAADGVGNNILHLFIFSSSFL